MWGWGRKKRAFFYVSFLDSDVRAFRVYECRVVSIPICSEMIINKSKQEQGQAKDVGSDNALEHSVLLHNELW